MKRWRVVICLLIVLAALVGAEDRYTLTFRATWWGMSMEQVRKTERSPYIGEDKKQHQMIYAGKLSGFECRILYGFERNKLVSGAYVIDSELVKHVNLNSYLDDYDRLRELMVRKYDRPWLDGPKWKTTQYRDYDHKYGLAVSTGILSYLTTWTTEGTEITLGLQGKDGRIALTILYTGVTAIKLEAGQEQAPPSDL